VSGHDLTETALLARIALGEHTRQQFNLNPAVNPSREARLGV
jgi:hypothetical protein